MNKLRWRNKEKALYITVYVKCRTSFVVQWMSTTQNTVQQTRIFYCNHNLVLMTHSKEISVGSENFSGLLRISNYLEGRSAFRL